MAVELWSKTRLFAVPHDPEDVLRLTDFIPSVWDDAVVWNDADIWRDN